MSGSALLPYLPLVGAFLGAVIGAAANGLYRDWQDRKARDRELRGLLYLIAVEINTNRPVLDSFKDLPLTVTKTSDAQLHSTVWEDARMRLAQLMQDRNDFIILALYYQNVDLAKSNMRHESLPDTMKQTLVSSLAESMLEQSQEVEDAISKYTSLPPETYNVMVKITEDVP